MTTSTRGSIRVAPTRVCGVDEAGRGPVLGPMALAAVVLDSAGARALRRLGIADSKQFGSTCEGQQRRAELAAAVRERAIASRCVLVEVAEIDRFTFRGQLNALERKVARSLLQELHVARDERIICDGALLFSPLRAEYPRLRAVNHGESVHVAVAAASVLAKHERDTAFRAIACRYEAEFGPLRGGGYVNAPTRSFLADYERRYGGLPPEARRSWTLSPMLTLPALDDRPIHAPDDDSR